MDTDILVSVIVPVYNAERRLHICLDSLLGQTLKNIEIILAEDGSTDNSAAICDSYADLDSRITVLHLPNGGPSKARNQAMEAARGKYLGFVDSDDYAADNLFEKLYQLAETAQSDIAMCNYYIEQDGKAVKARMSYDERYVGKEVKEKLLYRYYTENHNGLFCLWNKLFRRSLVIENKIKMDESLIRAEDAWFVFDCLKAAQRVAFTQENLYFYYQNEASIMHRVYTDQYEKWVATRNKLLQENKELGFDIDYNEFYCNFLYNLAVYLRTLIRRGEEAAVKEILTDEFYRNAARYRAKLPFHISLLHKLGRTNMIGLTIKAYQMWK